LKNTPQFQRVKPKPDLDKIAGYKIRLYGRIATSFMRVLPDFLIIGAAKAGTTSLYNYLIQHPEVAAPYRKEVRFFDRRYSNGLSWYKAHFPLSSEMSCKPRRKITGESSPYYLYHPLVPERVFKDLPGVKLICLLRNPIDRAVSNYNHRIRLGIEDQPIEKAFEAEQARIEGEELKLISNEHYNSYNHYHFSYLSRGYYADQLKRWYKHFKKNDLLVIPSERFYNDPATEFRKVTDHLGIDRDFETDFKPFNQGGGEYHKLDPGFRSTLEAHFNPRNKELFGMLGEEFEW
jgi:hypothetical protein